MTLHHCGKPVDVACGGVTCVKDAVGLAKRETDWQLDKRHGSKAMAAEEIEALRRSVYKVDASEGRCCGWRCTYAALIVRMATEWR